MHTKRGFCLGWLNTDTFLEKCEATFYESGGGGEKSFEETFAPEVGWEAYLADLKERVS